MGFVSHNNLSPFGLSGCLGFNGSCVTSFPVLAVIFLIIFILPYFRSAAWKFTELECPGPLSRHQIMYPLSSLSVKKNPISVLRVSAIICRVGMEGMVRPFIRF